MRKYVLVTADFSGFGFTRFIYKGDQVIIAYQPKEKMDWESEEGKNYLRQGNGMVQKFPLEDIMKRRNKMKDWYFIWDGNHNHEENTILRKEKFKVFAGMDLTYKMENDREFGINLAEELGLVSPDHQEFKSTQDGIKFLESNPEKAYVFKANGSSDCSLTTVLNTPEPVHNNLEMRQFLSSIGINDFILQEKVFGVEANIEYLCMNGVPVLAQVNLECKRRSNGDLGDNIGCAMDVCWSVPLNCPLVLKTVAKLLPLIEKTKYTGFADMNVIIGEDEVFFLEWCWRCGYNQHPNFFTTISKIPFLETVAQLIDGTYVPQVKSGFGTSLTIRMFPARKGMPIYVPETLERNFFLLDGFKKKDALLTGGCEGNGHEVGIVTAHNYTIPTAFHDVIENAHRIKLVNADYRTDGDKTDYPLSPLRRYEALKAMNLI